MKSNLISPDFFPNFEKDDFELIKKILKERNNWIKGREVEVFKFELKKFFPNSEIFLFSSGRGAIEFFLKYYLKDKKNKKIAIQAFTCFVVPKAIINAGGIPIFIDIKEGYLNFTRNELENLFKNNNDIAAVILQNTFGIPNNLDDILEFLKEKNVLIIENLAHSFGAKFKGKYLGNYGDVAILSFDRSKVISSIFGGALIINNKNLAEDLKYFYYTLKDLNKWFILKTLIYSLIMIKGRERFNTYWKFLMYIIKKLNLGVLNISKKERKGITEEYLLSKMPNAFAKIALNQIKKLIKFSEHREKIKKIYLREGLIPYGEKMFDYEFYYLRYPMTTNNPKKLINSLKKFNVYLGDWYNSVLAPINKRLDRFGYYYNMCPNAERLSMIIYNLPTNILIKEEDALFLTELIKNNL